MRIYLDTFVFMDLLSDNPEFAKKALGYLEKIKSGENRGCISAALFTELAFHIKRRKGAEKASEIIYYIQSLPNLEIIPLTSEIAQAAGLLRSKLIKYQKKFTYFDCIHLATAIGEKCDVFVTGDRGFRDVADIKVEIY